MLTATGPSRSFGILTAVNKRDFVINRGTLYGLVGDDGAGETTTMRLLKGIVPARHLVAVLKRNGISILWPQMVALLINGTW